jgi:outer membrane protein TolC
VSGPKSHTELCRHTTAGVLAVLLLVLLGCKTTVSDRIVTRSARGQVVSDDDEAHYATVARNVSRTMQVSPPIALGTEIGTSPRTIRQRMEDQPWPLALIEAVQIAVRNNPVVRQNAQFLSPSSTLLRAPDQAASVYDTAIAQTSVLFGSRGPDAAWSDFMPTWTSSLTFGRDMTVPNNTLLAGGLPLGSTLSADTAQFRARLDQPLMTGGTFSLVHNWDYTQNNSAVQLFPSAYSGELGAEFRQPLWAGAGVGFTEVAGPVSTRSPVQNGVFQGVRIAHLNHRIAAVDLELQIRNLVRDVGEQYWQLFQAFRDHEAEVAVRDAALEVWQQVRANEAALGGAIVAQAEQTYLDARSRAENALSSIYESEVRLRWLMGLPIADGRLLTPNALPMTGETSPDWTATVAEALQSRTELHRQKLNIESLDLQLQAARNLANPRLDFVGGYRLNGFGDMLYNQNTSDGITNQGYSSAYSSLFEGKHPGWDLGLTFSMPIGFRGEYAQIRNVELRLAKARVALQAQEHQITYEVGESLQQLAKWWTLLNTNEERQQVAQRQVAALEAEYRAGQGDRQTIDLLLRARQTLAQAQTEYYRAIAAYNVALWNLDFRKGTILASNMLQFESVVASRD